MILTYELINDAVALVKPTVEAILKQKGSTWGPKYVNIAIAGPGIEGIPGTVLGFLEEWKEKWGPPKNFHIIAVKKAQVSQRTGMPSALVVSRQPWLLEEGDLLYQGGVAETPGGLAVGVSGALSQTDECIAWLIYHAIEMFCRLEVRDMESKGINEV